MAWSSTKLRDNQAKWAIPVAPGVLLGLGYLSLHTGLDFYLDLTSSASTALLFFTIWTAYLNWRTQHLQDAASRVPALSRVVMQLGALGTLPSQQPGWVYVRLTVASDTSASAMLQAMWADIDPKPLSVFVSPDRKKTYDEDKHWRTIWSDVAEASLQMEYPT